MQHPTKLTSIGLQLLLRNYYETYYGLQNYATVSETNPIPHIAFLDEEDVFEVSAWRERLASFRKAKVHQTFGVSWNEFLELPRDQCLAMLEETEIDVSNEAAEAAAVQNSYRNK